jgi:hypothetical protein
MATRTDRPAPKLGPNHNEPSRKSRQVRRPSESCDLHEDRGATQSKFAHPKPSVRPVMNECAPERARRNVPFPADKPLLITEDGATEAARSVQLRLASDAARTVSVAGSFNDWRPGQTPLQKDGNGIWQVHLRLPPGDYEYRFVVDGAWADDPLACRHAANPFGGVNALLRVHG